MRRVRIAALVAAVITVASVAGMAAAANADQGGQSALSRLRNATARYHDLDKTLASGRVDLDVCFDHMGQHFGRLETQTSPPFDGTVETLDPEALVYADDGQGHLRLVAVEWIATQKNVDVIDGQDLHFSSAVGLWVLHAWIWSPNPDGMFADMNPRIGNCP